jgi:chemotaxis signal transduction protein/nucleoid-associated protein YgaU
MATNDDAALLTFKVGPFRLGVPAISVEAILNMPDFRSVPLSRPSVAGVFAYRDQVAVIICLRRKFGLPPQDDSTSGQLMLTRLGTGLTAFWVDEVLDMTTVSETDRRPLNTFAAHSTFHDFVLNDEQIFLRTDFETLYALDDSAPVNASEAEAPPPSKNPEVASPPVPSPSVAPPPAAIDQKTGVSVGKPANHVTSTPPPERRRRSTTAARPSAAYRNRTRDTLSGRIKQPAQARRANAAEAAAPPAQRRIVLATLIVFGLALGGLAGYALWPPATTPVAKVEPVTMRLAADRTIAIVKTPPRQPTPPPHKTKPAPVEPAAASPAAATIVAQVKESAVAAATNHSAPLTPTLEPVAPETPALTPERSAPAPSDPIVWRVETNDFILTIERPQPGTPPASPAPGAGIQENVHVVVPGDTLWHIARRYLGDPFRYAELAELSRIKNPDLIYPGDIVRIRKKTASQP